MGRDRTDPEWQEERGMIGISKKKYQVHRRRRSPIKDALRASTHDRMKKSLNKVVEKGVADFKNATEMQKLIRTKQTTQTICVFSALQSVGYVARIAFGIENAMATCPDSKGLRNKICAVNGLLVV